jgi:DNA-binding HxlR family transcriptional regulator
MLGRDYSGQNCSIARALEILGERWTFLIVRDAFLGVRRFDSFGRKLGIAPNVLSKRLGTLVDGGVLERRLYEEHPPRHEYVLTDRGRELFPVVVGLMDWGDRHLAPDGPPVALRHRDCGGVLSGAAVCRECGETVDAGDSEWWWGPGSGRGSRPIRTAAVPGG